MMPITITDIIKSRKIKYICSLLTLIAILLILILLNKNSEITVLFHHQEFSTNAQYVPEMNEYYDKNNKNSLYFFTGTNIGFFTKNQILQPYRQTSRSLWSTDIPFDAVSRVIKTKQGVFIYALINKDNQFFNTITGLNNNQYSLGEYNWFKVSNSGKVSALGLRQGASKIIDIHQSDKHVYMLIRRANDNNGIYIYEQHRKESTASYKNVGDTEGSTIVGQASDGSLYTRSHNGTLYRNIFNGSSAKSEIIHKDTGIVKFDKKTRSVIFTTVDRSKITDEGGVLRDDDNLSVTIINTDDNGLVTNNIYFPSNFFVSNGYILAIKNTPTKPDMLTAYDINAKKNNNIEINGESRYRVKDIIVFDDNLGVVGIINPNNTLYLMSFIEPRDTRFIFPRFNNTSRYAFNYSIAKSRLTISTINNTVHDFRGSLATARKSCSCDLNQVHKSWVYSKSGLEQFSDTEVFTGDGVPPELQRR